MKNNTLRKMLSCVLVGAMAATMLVGCGSKEEASTSSSAPAASTTTDAAPAATDSSVGGIDGFKAFDNTVNLQVAVYQRPEPNGCADATDNYWTKWVQENFGDKYNINVEYVAIPRNDVMTQYAMLAASGDLPTLCMEYDYDKLATWVGEGYLQSYDMNQLKDVAPTYYQQMVNEGIDIYTTMNDEDYLMLGARPYGNTNYTYVTFYRKDWVKAAGYDSYPETATEELEMLKKIKADGVCEYPLGGSKREGAGLDQNYSYRDYPQDEETWVTTGDYQIPALSTEAQKRYLKLQNTFYNEGLINPEFSTRTGEDNTADFINGKCIQWSGYISANMDTLNSFYEANPDAELGVKINSGKFVQDATYGSSNSYRPNNPFGAMIGFANDATEDEVLAGMMYLEWMIQPENLFTMQWGIEGVNFNYDNGTPVAVADQKGLAEQQSHNNNVDMWMVVSASKSLGDIAADVKASSPQGLPQDFTDDIIANYNGQLALYQAGMANPDAKFGKAIDAFAEYSETLYAKYAEFADKLEMAKPEEFDAMYDDLSKQYLEAGYQAVIDERLELYKEGLSTKL